MAQTIKLRRSAVAGNKPTTAQIDLGELAINTYDGKIYFEKSGSDGDTIQEVFTTNAQNSGSLNVIGNTTITGSLNVSGSTTLTGPLRLDITNDPGVTSTSSSFLFSSASKTEKDYNNYNKWIGFNNK